MDRSSIPLRQFEKSPGVFGVMASRHIAKGDVLFRFSGRIVTERTRYSLQLDAFRHFYANGTGGLDDFTNHACSPNAYVVFPTMEMRALRDIECGEEILVNYCATEEELVEPFTCRCGSPECYGQIRGFRFLSRAQQECLKGLVSPWLKTKYGL